MMGLTSAIKHHKDLNIVPINTNKNEDQKPHTIKTFGCLTL